jgi:hypothetical protein
MYRILAAHAEVRERRHQRRHLVYQKPELLAEQPNQVWSWEHYQAARSGQMDAFRVVYHHRHL